MTDTCEEGYFCDDGDCECEEHFCKKHGVDLRECEENDTNGAVEGNCLCEGSRFDFQSCTLDDHERILEISRRVINVGFFDYENGKEPKILKVHRSAKKIIELYQHGQLLAKSLEKKGVDK